MRQNMTYVTISHWTATEWTAKMEAAVTVKFVPMIMRVGRRGANGYAGFEDVRYHPICK